MLTLGALAACHRGDREPIAPYGAETDGRAYVPAVVGQWREYDVVERLWDRNTPTESHYQLREVVDTVYQAPTGEVTYRIVRSRRPDSLSVWRADSVKALILTPAEARQTFANVPTVEFLFGVWEGRSWNPNMYNTADSTGRRFVGVGQATTLPNGRQFARTVRVVDDADTSIVARRQQEQVYAWQVGRIYRRRTVLDYCNGFASQGLCTLGSGYIERGRELEEQLRAWGPR